MFEKSIRVFSLLQILLLSSTGSSLSIRDQNTASAILSDISATTDTNVVFDETVSPTEVREEERLASFGNPRPIYPTQEFDPSDEDPALWIMNNTRVVTKGPTYLTGTYKKCKCGSRCTDYIVNGELARICDYPSTAAIVRAKDDKLFCGGSIINDRYVLTASHCIQSYRKYPEEIYIVVFSTEIAAELKPPGQKLLIEKILMHEKYNSFTVNNDVALIKLATPLILNNAGISPACVPVETSPDYSGKDGTVVGWGTKEENSQETSKTLMRVKVPIITNLKCSTESDASHYKNKITNNMLCAGYEAGGKDSCQGDSGGPLFVEDDDRNMLVGVVSWGVGCARKKSPGVYARVSQFSRWIEENTKDGQYCSE
ncbi:unnamed protein product [Allacma fusca]|uniref:Peptidase S1 domain-containing protein n=1 Tax=Allacma fusca TaxID=39272 RepID=A0A8J2P2L8_9HEXA|nr:unnamed protein product [Allacma fusca]